MNNIISIALFIVCFVVAVLGVIGFFMAFRPEAFSNDKTKTRKFKRFGRRVLTFFIIVFIIGFLLMIYILWGGFQHA